MSATLNKPGAPGNAPTVQQLNQKPSLAGVKSKQRKGLQKATAKFEPAVFRDQLIKHLESVPQGDFDGYANKLDAISNQGLDYRKYETQLLEVLIVGGMLAPGGSYVDDGAPRSPFCIFNAKDPVEIDDMKKHVLVFSKLMRKLKYLLKTFDDVTLKTILTYKWPQPEQDKLAVASAMFVSEDIATHSLLTSLQKDHLVKDGASVAFLTTYFRTFLAVEASTTDAQLTSALRSAKVHELESFFPPAKRTPTEVMSHFTQAGLPRVVEIYKRQRSDKVKEQVRTILAELVEAEEPNEVVSARLKESKAANTDALSDAEYVDLIWKGIIRPLDMSSRPDQIGALAVKEVAKRASILEPFCTSANSQLGLINSIQIWCYENTKLLSTFANFLKVLYNEDVLSSEAIIYWHAKGKQPQGRQQFLKNTEGLIKALKEAEESEEEDE